MKSTIALTILALNVNAVLAVDYSAAVCKNPSDYLPDHFEDDGDTCNELASLYQMTSTANCSTAVLDSHGTSMKSKTDMLGLPSRARGSRYKCCGTGQGACQPDPIDYSAVVCKNPSDYLPEHKEEDDGMTCDARALQFQMPSKADCSTEALDSHGTSKKSMTDMLQSRFKCCGTGQSACGAESAAAAERFTQASLLATILLAVTSMMMC